MGISVKPVVKLFKFCVQKARETGSCLSITGWSKIPYRFDSQKVQASDLLSWKASEIVNVYWDRSQEFHSFIKNNFDPRQLEFLKDKLNRPIEIWRQLHREHLLRIVRYEISQRQEAELTKLESKIKAAIPAVPSSVSGSNGKNGSPGKQGPQGPAGKDSKTGNGAVGWIAIGTSVVALGASLWALASQLMGTQQALSSTSSEEFAIAKLIKSKKTQNS